MLAQQEKEKERRRLCLDRATDAMCFQGIDKFMRRIPQHGAV
jgi:hypothetical protein